MSLLDWAHETYDSDDELYRALFELPYTSLVTRMTAKARVAAERERRIEELRRR